MSRNPAESPPDRPTSFLDRGNELRVLRGHVTALEADASHFAVFEVLGLGGVGKTRFLDELRGRLERSAKPLHLVWVSLEAEAAATATGPLRLVRNQLPFECPLFDAAVLRYWAASGQPLQQLVNRSRGRTLAMRAVELLGGLAGVPLPITFASDLFSTLGRKLVRERRYDREEFEAIDRLHFDPGTLFTNLPGYLASDVKRRLDTASRQRLVFFYDGYENQSRATLEAKAPWLQRLIGDLRMGVHVVAARNALGWEPARHAIHTLTIGPLPESQSRQMIRDALGPLDPRAEDKLVASSHGFPFFLHASIDVCREVIRERGPIDVEDVPAHPEAIVERLLNHLERTEQKLAVVLASVQHFDEPLYAQLVHDLNLQVDVMSIDEFVEAFFVQEESEGLFKTHDLLTEAVRAGDRHRRVKERALPAATTHLWGRTSGAPSDELEVLLQLFRSLVQAWSTTDAVPPASAELLVEVGYAFYDAGYWKSLKELPVGPDHQRHAATFIARFFAALAARRTDGVPEALRQLEPLEADRVLMGRHASYFDVEVAYLSELSGNYARARQEFAVLDERATPFDETRRDHVRGRLYHADMLINDGQFVEASRLLVAASDDFRNKSSLDWAEFVRHRGHAHRLSFLFDMAEQLYRRAMEAAERSPSLQGKLYTNLAETRCWTDPDAALADAAIAIRRNTEVGNLLEVAKCDTAVAIALARSGEIAGAREAQTRARQQFAALGYPAGVGFAYQAGIVVAMRAGFVREADALYRHLARHVSSLGTYGHLCVMPASLRGDQSELERWTDDVEWIEPDQLEARLHRLVSG